jgi:hypothetical protein
MNDNPNIIRPETIAAKLAALKNLQSPHFRAAAAKEPRLVELAWHLQALSMKPCGIQNFADTLLEEFADRIGTPAMHRIGKTAQPYTASERQAVIEDVPGHHDPATWVQDDTEPPLRVEETGDYEEYVKEWGIAGDKQFCRRVPNAEYVNKQNHGYFFKYCLRIAHSELPWMLEKFCTEPDACFEKVFWFHDLTGALIDMLDAQAGRARQAIAMTQVARDIFRTLQFAWDEKAMVKITGDSRFGKTEAVKAWCAMHPGKARLVKTPCTCDERSFLEALADALGVNRGLEITTAKLRAAIEYIVRHAGLMFVFDESAWLVPSRYTDKTTPVRLNYIRCQLLDNGCPVALVETPQFIGRAMHKFERTTGFNMAQFKGRVMREIKLPSELPEQDLLAVVNIHFPDLRPSLAKRIVATALLSDSFLFAVEKISKNARAVARENGRTQIGEDDLNAGIALAGITAPASGRLAPAAVTSPPRQQAPIAVKRGRPSTTSTTSTAPLAMPTRATTPAMANV